MIQSYLHVIKQASIFQGIETDHLLSILNCLSARVVRYRKQEIAVLAGSRLEHIGVVLAGKLHITREDSAGDRMIVASVIPPEIYGETICSAEMEQSPVTVTASEESVVLLLNFSRTLQVCSNTCVFHTKIIKNMLALMATKNLFLQNRMDIVSKKSVRAKVMMYLESFVPAQGREITVPLNREKMAEYLCIDRSALSHELIKMKQDGLIDYDKNRFTLISPGS